MQHEEKMSLKAFWEAVERRLATYSADELRSILRAMAKDTPPTERRAFLEKLKPSEKIAGPPLHQEDLLTDIDELAHELRAMMKRADYYWEEYGDEEETLGPYEEFVEPLTALFDRATSPWPALPIKSCSRYLTWRMITGEGYGRTIWRE